jgi:hypothetical protein
MRGILISALLLSSVTAAYADVAQDTSGTGNASRVLKVFDAQGKLVGPLDTFQLTEGVYLRFAGGAAVFMPLRHKKVSATQYAMSQFEWSDVSGTGFTSTDCSGPPLIGIGQSPRPVALVRSGGEVTAYIAGPQYASKMTSHSSISYDGSCETYDSSRPSYWTPQITFSLSQRYPEPLSIHY